MRRTIHPNTRAVSTLATALAILGSQAGNLPTAYAHSQTTKPSGGITWTNFHEISRESGRSSEDASQTPSKTTEGSKDRRKELLAAAAIEDAAQFYGSGEIKGVLPLIINEFRAIQNEQAHLSDEEIIDSIVQSAQMILDATERAASHPSDQR